MGSIPPDVTTIIPNLVYYRISCLQITLKPQDSPFNGEQRGVISRRAARNRADETPCCCIFIARCLFMRSGHEWDCMISVMISMMSFYKVQKM